MTLYKEIPAGHIGEIEKRVMREMEEEGLSFKNSRFRVIGGRRIKACLKTGTDRTDKSRVEFGSNLGLRPRNLMNMGFPETLSSQIFLYGPDLGKPNFLNQFFVHLGIVAYAKEELVQLKKRNALRHAHYRPEGVFPTAIFKVLGRPHDFM